MATTPAPDVALAPVGGEARPIEDWVTVFHLVLVVARPVHPRELLAHRDGRTDPAHLQPRLTAASAWLVTANDDEAKAFLGPWSDELLTFADPDRSVVKALELEQLPAIVHIDHGLNVVASAEGWNPDEWRDVATGLATQMSWTRPAIPGPGDPTPYAGTPAT